MRTERNREMTGSERVRTGMDRVRTVCIQGAYMEGIRSRQRVDVVRGRGEDCDEAADMAV